MKPRITVITVGVDDLERSLRFYRDGLGFATQGIVGKEFAHGAVVFFDLQAGMKLALWPRTSVAHDTGLPLSAASPTEFTIGHNVASKSEVDAVMAQAQGAGAVIVKAGARHILGRLRGLFSGPRPASVGGGLESALGSAGLTRRSNRDEETAVMNTEPEMDKAALADNVVRTVERTALRKVRKLVDELEEEHAAKSETGMAGPDHRIRDRGRFCRMVPAVPDFQLTRNSIATRKSSCRQSRPAQKRLRRNLEIKEALIKYGFVIPAKAGIQDIQAITGSPPTRGRLNQRLLKVAQATRLHSFTVQASRPRYKSVSITAGNVSILRRALRNYFPGAILREVLREHRAGIDRLAKSARARLPHRRLDVPFRPEEVIAVGPQGDGVELGRAQAVFLDDAHPMPRFCRPCSRRVSRCAARRPAVRSLWRIAATGRTSAE